MNIYNYQSLDIIHLALSLGAFYSSKYMSSICRNTFTSTVAEHERIDVWVMDQIVAYKVLLVCSTYVFPYQIACIVVESCCVRPTAAMTLINPIVAPDLVRFAGTGSF